MEMMYILISFILLLGLCFYIAKNFAELAEFINSGEKLTKQEKGGLKFLKTKKCLNLFIVSSLALIAISYFGFEVWYAKVFYSVCCIFLLGGFFMDVSVKLLPDVFTISLLWIGLLGSVLGITGISPSCAILSALGIYLFFMLTDALGEIITKKTVMGGGDIKIMSAFGALFGVMATINIMIVACIIMILFVGLIKLSKKTCDKELPFGLGLSVAAMFYIFLPNMIMLGLSL